MNAKVKAGRRKYVPSDPVKNAPELKTPGY